MATYEISIIDWSKYYENSESRKYKTLKWVPIPNTFDGAGFRRLAKLKNSCEIFTAWILLLEMASRSEIRGNLRISSEDAAERTGYSSKIFDKAIIALSSKEIGWINVLESPEISGNLRMCSDVSENLPLNRREENRKEYSSSFLAFWEQYPKKVGKGAAWKEWEKGNPPLEACLVTLAWQKVSADWTKENGKYIVDPERWIKRRRWEDEKPQQQFSGMRKYDPTDPAQI